MLYVDKNQRAFLCERNEAIEMDVAQIAAEINKLLTQMKALSMDERPPMLQINCFNPFILYESLQQVFQSITKIVAIKG